VDDVPDDPTFVSVVQNETSRRGPAWLSPEEQRELRDRVEKDRQKLNKILPHIAANMTLQDDGWDREIVSSAGADFNSSIDRAGKEGGDPDERGVESRDHGNSVARNLPAVRTEKREQPWWNHDDHVRFAHELEKDRQYLSALEHCIKGLHKTARWHQEAMWDYGGPVWWDIAWTALLISYSLLMDNVAKTCAAGDTSESSPSEPAPVWDFTEFEAPP
jgi:hypothetical protein